MSVVEENEHYVAVVCIFLLHKVAWSLACSNAFHSSDKVRS